MMLGVIVTVYTVASITINHLSVVFMAAYHDTKLIHVQRSWPLGCTSGMGAETARLGRFRRKLKFNIFV